MRVQTARDSARGVAAAAGLLLLGGCLLSQTEVVRPEDGVIVPGLHGEYLQVAAPEQKDTVLLGGQAYGAKPVRLTEDAVQRAYSTGAGADGAAVRLMRVNERFHLAQIPLKPKESAAYGVRWFLALARIDAAAGLIDLHCIGPVAGAASAPKQPADNPAATLVNVLFAGYLAPESRDEALRAVTAAAAGTPPLMTRLVRRDVAERGLPPGQPVQSSAAACMARTDASGGQAGGSADQLRKTLDQLLKPKQ
jgi:hypothetical protein